MMKLIEKVLGLGVIPEDWKQRVYSLLLVIVEGIELFYDIPDEWHTEAMLTKYTIATLVVVSFVLKKLRKE